jgi:hypothetical protein
MPMSSINCKLGAMHCVDDCIQRADGHASSLLCDAAALLSLQVHTSMAPVRTYSRRSARFTLQASVTSIHCTSRNMYCQLRDWAIVVSDTTAYSMCSSRSMVAFQFSSTCTLACYASEDFAALSQVIDATPLHAVHLQASQCCLQMQLAHRTGKLVSTEQMQRYNATGCNCKGSVIVVHSP